MVWNLKKLIQIYYALISFRNAIGSDAWGKYIAGVRIELSPDSGMSSYYNGVIYLTGSINAMAGALNHELFHRLKDTGGDSYLTENGETLNQWMESFEQETGWTCSSNNPDCNPGTGPTDYSRNLVIDPYTGKMVIVNSEEDAAESVMVSIIPNSISQYPLSIERKYQTSILFHTSSTPGSSYMNHMMY